MRTTQSIAGRAANYAPSVQAGPPLLESGRLQNRQRNTLGQRDINKSKSGSLSNYVVVALVYGAVLRHSVGDGLRIRCKNLRWGGNARDTARGSSVNSSVSVSVTAACVAISMMGAEQIHLGIRVSRPSTKTNVGERCKHCLGVGCTEVCKGQIR